MKIAVLAPLACLIALLCGAVSAQMPDTCEVTSVTDPVREVLTCASGLIIEFEAAEQLGLIDAGQFGLNGGAALIETSPGDGDLQIRTPHAIAAVRGTVFAVDVSQDATAVFVVRGQVDVTSLLTRSGPVTLGPGQGVDVTANDPLTVKTWGAARVSGLLARFGR